MEEYKILVFCILHLILGGVYLFGERFLVRIMPKRFERGDSLKLRLMTIKMASIVFIIIGLLLILAYFGVVDILRIMNR